MLTFKSVNLPPPPTLNSFLLLGVWSCTIHCDISRSSIWDNEDLIGWGDQKKQNVSCFKSSVIGNIVPSGLCPSGQLTWKEQVQCVKKRFFCWIG